MQENVEQRKTEIEINLQELLLQYLKRWWVFALCVLIAATSSFLVAWKFVTPTYRATFSVYVNNNRTTDEIDYLTSADVTAAKSLVNTYVNIATSRRVLDAAADVLGEGYSGADLVGKIKAERVESTEIFKLHVVNTDKYEAFKIADAMAEVIPSEISSLILGTSAKIIDEPQVPAGRYSPSYTRAVMIGGLIGAVAALAFVTVLYLQDNRIKDEDDLTSMFNISILGRIPNFEYTPSSNTYGYGADKEKNEEADEA